MKIIVAIISVFVLTITTSIYSQSTYYISNDGNDDYNGQAATYKGGNIGPWRTVKKVNNRSFNRRKTIVKFMRGDVWREQIVGKSNITYTDYGFSSLPKPLFLGSIQGKNRKWMNEGNSIWSTTITKPDHINLITNATFDKDYSNWDFNPKRTNTSISIVDSAVKISGNQAGQSQKEIQFFTDGLHIQKDIQYQLSFRAKTNGNGKNRVKIKLEQSEYPYKDYSNDIGHFEIDENKWTSYVFYFTSNTFSTNAAIKFYLDSNADSWELFLDDIHLSKMLIPGIDGEMISNASFEKGIEDWSIWTKKAVATLRYDSTNASAEIHCVSNGNNQNDIQFFTETLDRENRLVIQDQFKYKLTFKAKSTAPLNNIEIKLAGGESFRNTYASKSTTVTIDKTNWAHYVYYFDSNINKKNESSIGFNRNLRKDARIVFYLGNTGNNWTLNLDDISLEKVVDDIGSIVFNTDDNDEKNNQYGVKKHSLGELNEINDYYTDRFNSILYLKSKVPPNELSQFEIAMTLDMIHQENKRKVAYNNLSFMYSGGNGFDGFNHKNVTFTRCDFKFIGGGYQPNEETTRYGNGITFWGDAKNITVEACRFHQIYDNAVTNQTGHGVHKKIYYRNNFISNCELPFSSWNKGQSEKSSTKKIYFVNNTSILAGEVWSNKQRPDKRATHVIVANDMVNKNSNEFKVFVKNNIFYGSNKTFLFFENNFSLRNIKFENNLFFDDGDLEKQRMIYIERDVFPKKEWCTGGVLLNWNWYYFQSSYCDGVHENQGYTEFVTFVDSYLGAKKYDLGSIIQDPTFRNIEEYNIKLDPSSICVDRGVKSTESGRKDFFGNTRSSGKGIDIGCFEFQGR